MSDKLNNLAIEIKDVVKHDGDYVAIVDMVSAWYAEAIKPLESRNILLEKKVEKLREALKLAVGWMEPIMDGFSIPDKQKDGSPSARVVVLNAAKAALSDGSEKE